MGSRDEGTTECYGLQSGVEIGRRLGLSEETARQLMRQQLAENALRAGGSVEYRVPPECRDGGRLDLDPGSTSFRAFAAYGPLLEQRGTRIGVRPHGDVDRRRLAHPCDQVAGGEVVQQELERLRLSARLVPPPNVEREPRGVQRVALSRLGIPRAEKLLVRVVAHRARDFERPGRSAHRLHACPDVDERSQCLRAQAAVELLRLAEARRELAHRPVDREPERGGIVREWVQDVVVPRPLEIGRVREALRLEGRVQYLLGRALGCVQEIELLQAIAVLAIEPHDLLRGEHAPVVGRRIVAQSR